MALQLAIHVVIVQPPQVVREPLVLDCQQPEKGRLPRTLTAHKTEHGFKFASRLEYPLDGSQQENFRGFASVLILRSTEKMVQDVGYPFRAVPFQTVQVIPDGVVPVLVGNNVDSRFNFLFAGDASKMTYQQAALCEPFTIGLQANWRGDVRPGDVVLVHGGGPIGLIVANIAKSRGATVIVSEPNESRLAMAKDFGADYSINPMKEDLDAFINKLTDGEGVNVIFEAAGVPALLAHATSQLSPAGRLVAMTFGKEINAKELTILGTRHQYQKFPEVVKILPDHLKEVDEITTHVFKAEDFQKAFDTLADRNSGAGKVVLTFA